MKFNFKIQQYQTDAVNAVVNVFNGQGHYDKTKYIRDLGKINKQQNIQQSFDSYSDDYDALDDTAIKMSLLNCQMSNF